MSLFWWFIPENLWPWILVGLAAGWLVGLVRLRTIVAMAAITVLWPFIEEWLVGLARWVQYVLAFLLVLAFVRDLLAFFLGDRAADHAMGEFVGHLLKVFFWGLVVPFKVLFRVIRWGVLRMAERWP